MKEPECMLIEAKYILQEFIKEYKLHNKIHNVKIYVHVNKGMHG